MASVVIPIVGSQERDGRYDAELEMQNHVVGIFLVAFDIHRGPVRLWEAKAEGVCMDGVEDKVFCCGELHVCRAEGRHHDMMSVHGKTGHAMSVTTTWHDWIGNGR